MSTPIISNGFLLLLCKPGVANPGPGEPQGVLAFVLTQHLIYKLKRLITQDQEINSPHLVLGSELVADFRVIWGSPGPGLATPDVSTCL